MITRPRNGNSQPQTPIQASANKSEGRKWLVAIVTFVTGVVAVIGLLNQLGIIPSKNPPSEEVKNSNRVASSPAPTVTPPRAPAPEPKPVLKEDQPDAEPKPISSPPKPSKCDGAQEKYDLALGQYKSGDYKGAFQTCEAALKYCPGNEQLKGLKSEVEVFMKTLGQNKSPSAMN